jgi:hypothetical protein
MAKNKQKRKKRKLRKQLAELEGRVDALQETITRLIVGRIESSERRATKRTGRN